MINQTDKQTIIFLIIRFEWNSTLIGIKIQMEKILVIHRRLFKDGVSGYGATIYHKQTNKNAKIRDISSPNGRTSIVYAELFSILSVL